MDTALVVTSTRRASTFWRALGQVQDRPVLTAANSSNIQGVRQGTSLFRPPACSPSAPAILMRCHGISQEQQRAMTLQGDCSSL